VPSTAPDRKGILELLDYSSNLKTPAFQRTVAWASQQVDEFWTDLTRALDAPPVDEYFLGLVVLDTDRSDSGRPAAAGAAAAVRLGDLPVRRMARLRSVGSRETPWDY